jgi:hypothetical protein
MFYAALAFTFLFLYASRSEAMLRLVWAPDWYDRCAESHFGNSIQYACTYDDKQIIYENGAKLNGDSWINSAADYDPAGCFTNFTLIGQTVIGFTHYDDALCEGNISTYYETEPIDPLPAAFDPSKRCFHLPNDGGYLSLTIVRDDCAIGNRLENENICETGDDVDGASRCMKMENYCITFDFCQMQFTTTSSTTAITIDYSDSHTIDNTNNDSSSKGLVTLVSFGGLPFLLFMLAIQII